jgi:alpha-D-ribose 1-methylphosphonate 5-triphosphate synthase subunit PhnH
MIAGLEAGFADPVPDAQRCFRAVLDAAAAVLLTLVDHETPLWLDPHAGTARRWIEFHCGAPIVADPAACAFALALSLPDPKRLPAGSHEAPETSATVICEVDSFDMGTAFRLSGPGLREAAVLTVKGLPRDFVSIWRGNHALFPRGIDLILCAGDQLTALPRTVAIEEA